MSADSNRSILLVAIVMFWALILPPSAKPSQQAAGAPSADVIYRGGDVVTLDEFNTIAEALATKDGVILAVGPEIAVMEHRGPDTVVVESSGQTILPGFVDSHSHLILTAEKLGQVAMDPPPAGDVASIVDIQRKLRTALYERSLRPGEWLIGTGYDHAMLSEGRHPTRFDLDQVSTDVPVLLNHFSQHQIVVNSKGLAEVGIGAETKDPPGGVIRRIVGSSEPNGILEETAMGPVLTSVAGDSPKYADRSASDKARGQLLAALDIYASAGYTTVTDAWLEDLHDLELLRRMGEEGAVRQDVILFPHFDVASAEDVAALYSPTYVDHIRVGGGKINLDGGSPGRTAFLREPYHHQLAGEHDYRGYARYEDQRVVNDIVTTYYELGVPLVIHALGDAAVDQAVFALRRAESAVGEGRRTQLVHLQQIQEDQLDAVSRLDVTLSFQVAHNFYFGDFHNDVIYGPERTSRLNPAKSAFDRGLCVSIHHDSPIHPVDQMMLIWAAVNRVTRSGRTIGAEQRITVEEAFRASTINAAYQFREEGQKGSIEIGKLADLVILDRNPLEVDPMELRTIRVLATIKEGKVIFKASE